jgi:hypothetical protein
VLPEIVGIFARHSSGFRGNIVGADEGRIGTMFQVKRPAARAG